MCDRCASVVAVSLTPNPLTYSDLIGDGQRVAIDAAYLGPLALVVDSFHHNVDNVVDGRVRDQATGVADYDGAALVVVDQNGSGPEVLTSLVGATEIVHEPSRLKKGIFDDLATGYEHSVC